MSKAHIVPDNSKVDADFFINYILKPLIEDDIPRLYGDCVKDVRFQMNSAPAHTAKKTFEWLINNNVKWIPIEHWMANCPDMAPLDYGVNGNLERILFGLSATTVERLKKAIIPEWSKFELETVRNILSPWEKGVSLMIEKKGFHVDPIS